MASVLGDLRQFDKSDALAQECLKLSLESQNSSRLAQYLYGMAWNLIQRCSEEISDCNRLKALSLLKQAYSAAVISGDLARQHQISSYCQRALEKYLEF